MIRRNMKIAFISLIVSMLLTTMVTTIVLAINSADSATKQYTCYGKTYTNYASIWIYSNGAQARTAVDSNSGTVPSGYIGVQCLLYDSGGYLKKSTGWNYNSSACTGLSNGTSPLVTTRDSYYSKGKTKAYNGNGYNSYDTYQSPNLNY